MAAFTRIQKLALPLALSVLHGCFVINQDGVVTVVEPDPSQADDAPVEVPEVIPPDADPGQFLTDLEIVTRYGNVACNPLEDWVPSDGSVTNYRMGLRAHISFPPQNFNSAEWNNINRFTEPDAIKRPEPLFFSNVNVPTRKFDLGFPLLGGHLIENDSGTSLYEYFRIDFDGFLKPHFTSATKNMEFALLADDGARLKIGDTAQPTLGATQVIAESTGVHPTKMICGNGPVNLVSGSELPLEIDYFQGPRYHIAVMLLWREASRNPEPLCGTSGNSTFFDFEQSPSEPQQAFVDLQSRGWSVVGPENFTLPTDEPFNPCLSPAVLEALGVN